MTSKRDEWKDSIRDLRFKKLLNDVGTSKDSCDILSNLGYSILLAQGLEEARNQFHNIPVIIL